MKRSATVSWSGAAREGQGTFRVGSGALEAPFTYNSRFVGNEQTNPEELLLAALAGCLTMAMASAFERELDALATFETSAELDLVPHESGGYRIPEIRVEVAVEGEWTQEDLDRVVAKATQMCPICNALTGSQIVVQAHSAVAGDLRLVD